MSTTILKNQIDAVTPRAFTELITAAPQITGAFLRVAAVTHVSDIESISGPLTRALDVQSTDPAFLYAVRDSQPRAWLVSQTIVLPDSADRLRQILAGEFDPRRIAVVEAPQDALPTPPGTDEASVSPINGHVELSEPSPGRLVIRTRAGAESILIVADRYAPEISVEVDGQRGKLIRANHAFRGVRLSAGEHLVEMRYVPTKFWLGATVSGFAALVAIAGLVSQRRR
ncbi:MAG: YfhO family protein [Pirellulales bacterium]